MRILVNHTQRNTSHIKLSPLNREINRRHRRCERKGYHVPSGEFTERDYKGVTVSCWICSRCGVPQLPRVIQRAFRPELRGEL